MEAKQTPAILWALYQSRQMDDPNIGIEQGRELLKAVRRCIEAERAQMQYEGYLWNQDNPNSDWQDDFAYDDSSWDQLVQLENLLVWFVGDSAITTKAG